MEHILGVAKGHATKQLIEEWLQQIFRATQVAVNTQRIFLHAASLKIKAIKENCRLQSLLQIIRVELNNRRWMKFRVCISRDEALPSWWSADGVLVFQPSYCASVPVGQFDKIVFSVHLSPYTNFICLDEDINHMKSYAYAINSLCYNW